MIKPEPYRKMFDRDKFNMKRTIIQKRTVLCCHLDPEKKKPIEMHLFQKASEIIAFFNRIKMRFDFAFRLAYHNKFSLFIYLLSFEFALVYAFFQPKMLFWHFCFYFLFQLFWLVKYAQIHLCMYLAHITSKTNWICFAFDPVANLFFFLSFQENWEKSMSEEQETNPNTDQLLSDDEEEPITAQKVNISLKTLKFSLHFHRYYYYYYYY